MEFTDLHECMCVRTCRNRAVAWALFAGTHTLVCGEHISEIDRNHDVTFYTADGEAFEL